MLVKRIGTITWISFYNFGTFLQAYALQQILKNRGFENAIISDKAIVRQMIMQRYGFTFYIKRFLYDIYERVFVTSCYAKGVRKSCSMYKQFAAMFLTIDENWKNFKNLNSKYDIFVCGSDQIWSPVKGIFNPFYYLSFVNKKKIAYAPSIGVNSYPNELKDKVKSLLDSFSSISVREENGAKLLRSFINKEIATVLDPTLLLTTAQWESIIEEKEKVEPYVLCYLLTYNQIYIDFVSKYAKEQNLKLKFFITDKRYLVYADIPLFVGPIEFLEEIHAASYFFTDSFHGTIFALQFKKRFATFKRFKDIDDKNQNSRLDNLFTKLNLKKYFIDEINLSEISQLPKIDYDRVHAILDEERVKSISFLLNSINI